MAPERVRAVLDYLAAGLNPMAAARAAGVSKSAVYVLDRQVSGGSRLAVKRRRRRPGRAGGRPAAAAARWRGSGSRRC